MLSLSEKWWRVFCLFTPYLSVIFVSRENLSIAESNEQICDFYKSVTFEKQRRCGTLQNQFLIANYSLNVIQRVIQSMPYLYLSVSRLVHVCAMRLCLCMCDIKSKPSHLLDLGKLMPCCIKHTARSFWY